MRKFIVQCKNAQAVIQEVECVVVRSDTQLKDGEWCAAIVEPKSLYRKSVKKVDGNEVVTHEPEVWYWHSLHESVEEATEVATGLIKWELTVFAKSKHRPESTSEEIADAISKIEIRFLKV